MKKILLTGMSLLMTAVVLTGCKKDDPDPSALGVENVPSTVVAAAGGVATFDIKSNTEWSITSNAAWATVSPASGKNDQKITVTAAANTGAARTAVLTVKTGDNKVTRTVDLDQAAAAEVPVTPQEVDLGSGSTAFEIKGEMKLTPSNIYILKGYVYVTEGATLTIEPGVIIKGDKASRATLVVEPGGKIMAEGTKDAPIVFTSRQAPGSRKPGDWGGLILMGKAKNNQGIMDIEGGPRTQHGGTLDTDNSGVLSYVRIEFAGIEYGVDNEINGLTMGSVGSGTKIDHIQVSHSGDDSFEWFGGAVDAKYLVAFRGWDDDFDADNGFSGKVQYGLIVRDPLVADKSASNGFESDNNSTAADLDPFTSAVFANVSSFGPVIDPANYVNKGNVNGSSPAGVFQAGVQLRRNTRLSLFNSVVAGWPVGLIIENDSKGGDIWAGYNGDAAVVSGVVLAGMQANYQDKATNAAPVVNLANGTELVSNYFTRVAGANRTFAAIADLKLSAAPGPENPVTIPAADSPLATGAVWTDAKVSTGFDPIEYIGAFGPTETAANNWTTGWTEFDPQNKVY